MSLTPENGDLIDRVGPMGHRDDDDWIMSTGELNRLLNAARAEGPSTGDGDVAGLADEVVTRLYRRFKDWSQRGFGPDDVTWCEVKADVLELIALSAPTKGDVAGLVEQLWDIVNARDDAEHGFPDWVRNPCMAAALALSAPTKSDELRKALEDVAKAAANMPRRTPAPGGAATEHAFTISAAKVWELDRALTALSTLQAKEAGR